MRWVLVFITGLLFALNAFALDVGDEQPGLANYSIDDSADYHGPWLDIQDYLDAGKIVVVSHWKQS
ncbi:MAG: hypothetical protein JSW52_11795 [Candidatus Coatesbacteria bacterium]|nr:MAG: hypothetical protein JSW52_11795 [Candidatus Coatesbacteria bacterium]